MQPACDPLRTRIAGAIATRKMDAGAFSSSPLDKNEWCGACGPQPNDRERRAGETGARGTTAVLLAAGGAGTCQ
jgi:hypothetical protein